MTGIEFPEMRGEVVGALQSLSDPDYQQRVWIERRYPDANYYDDLDLEVHILFDDIDVCVNPEAWVGAVLYPDEVEPLRALGQVLQAVIDDLGDRPDAEYLADNRWLEIVRLSRIALETTQRNP